MPDVDTGPITAIDSWKLRVAELHNELQGAKPRLLACGAKHWPGSPEPGDWRQYPEATWLGTDVESGDGVHYVSDLHTIDQACPDKFHGVYCQSVLEHLERPWVAVIAMGRLLLPGGALYIGTHHTFPLHGYPKDYFRFSCDALRTLVTDAGLSVLATSYDGPCTVSPAKRYPIWNDIAKAFTDVAVCAERPR